MSGLAWPAGLPGSGAVLPGLAGAGRMPALPAAGPGGPGGLAGRILAEQLIWEAVLPLEAAPL